MRGAKLGTTIAVAALAIAAATGCGGSGDDSAASATGDSLWGHHYMSGPADPGDGGPPPARFVSLSFSDRGKGMANGIAWHAHCNEFFAPAVVTASKIQVREPGGTLVGCMPQPEAEDEWLVDFFRSDPKWHLDGDVLVLAAGRATIEFSPMRAMPSP